MGTITSLPKGINLFFCLALIILPYFSTLANNINVSNASLSGKNETEGYIKINFDLAWDNSWRTSTLEANWDAAWVFVKFRKKSDSEWKHASINATGTDALTNGHTEPAGGTIDTPDDGRGVFIYRSSNGIGNVNFTGISLRWNYREDGLQDYEEVEIVVYAIEMVYVNGGDYYLGDNTTTNPYGTFETGTSGNAFLVQTENTLTLGGGSPNSLGNNNAATQTAGADDFNDTQSQILPAEFPKGYKAFYIMKYECSQEQYADFLSKLTATQAQNRFTAANSGNFRYTITGVHPVFSVAAPDRACNFISYPDAAAYLDWSGLRPLTELEYEKAARGRTLTNSVGPFTSEYAWHNANITQARTVLNNNTENETVAETSGLAPEMGLANYDPDGPGPTTNIGGPLRVGFAATATSTRPNAGAGYFGVMELSGNLWEIVISTGRPEGRAYKGTHGDGTLNPNGTHTNADWPLYNTSAGAGLRGGGFNLEPVYLQISNRNFVNTNLVQLKREYTGFRGVRTAP